MLPAFWNGSFPLPLLEAQGFFFIIFHRNLVMLLEVNLKIFWRLPYDWVLLEFITSTCPYQASSNSSITIQVSHLSTVSCSCFPCESLLFFFLPVGLFSLGDSSLPCISHLLYIQRVDFSVHSAFLLVIRMEW